MSFNVKQSLQRSKRGWSAVASLFVVVAAGTGTAVASVPGSSIHLKAPSSIAAGKQFTITASGTSPARNEWLAVVFTTTHPCPANWDAVRIGGWYGIVPFPGAYSDGAVKLGQGNYSVTSKPVHGAAKQTGKLCGLLFSKSNAPPQAHTSKSIKFT